MKLTPENIIHFSQPEDDGENFDFKIKELVLKLINYWPYFLS